MRFIEGGTVCLGFIKGWGEVAGTGTSHRAACMCVLQAPASQPLFPTPCKRMCRS